MIHGMLSKEACHKTFNQPMDYMKGTSNPKLRKHQSPLEPKVKIVVRVSHDDIKVWKSKRHR